MRDFHKVYQFWCENEAFDPETRAELCALRDEKEIEDRFYKELEFGTAGLRGIMGAGTNRMNRYTVGRATVALARFLKESFGDEIRRGVAVGYDTRHHSAEFAAICAAILSQENIPVYLFDQCVPTPLVSFAIRHFGCVSGVVITASHNPPAYNGYKAYDETGCQLAPESAKCVMQKIDQIAFSDIPQGENRALIRSIGDDVIDLFVNTILARRVNTSDEEKRALKVVYTPLHGTGKKPVLQALDKDGFTQVLTVEEQMTPDGAFPTVKSPNPEERGALLLGMELCQKEGADLVIGTDPDSDRIGCAVMHHGEMMLLTGNQTGALLVDYLLTQTPVLGENPTVVSTIVTSDLGKEIARRRGAEVREVLTGFKYIGSVATSFEREQEESPRTAHHFIIGYEESYGYLVGTHARDKDAVAAAMTICEMAAYHKAHGKTLIDALNDLYAEFGYYLDITEAFTLQGKEGLERIQSIMKDLRADSSFLPGLVRVEDFDRGIGDLPRSNVLKFHLSGGSWIAARPSGTEPKIKFYYCIHESGEDLARQKQKALRDLICQTMGL